jgi:hypothetical protein
MPKESRTLSKRMKEDSIFSPFLPRTQVIGCEDRREMMAAWIWWGTWRTLERTGAKCLHQIV